MRANAREGWADVAETDIAEFMANGARGGEERAAFGDVAGFLHVGEELRDELVFLRCGRIGDGKHRGGFDGDAGVGVRAETGDVARAKGGGADAVVFNRGNERAGGGRIFENLIEDEA